MKQVLLIALVMLAFSCQNSTNKKTGEAVAPAEVVEVKFQVKGMHCADCEQSVAKGVNELEGIEFVQASVADSMAVVRFDKSKTNQEEIAKKIEKRGYEVKGTFQ